ncbi:YbjN domain-containing protein [Streptomyces aculeolatus]
MSIDPSSIPNFGGQQPESRGGGGGPQGPIVPDQDLVKQLLEQMELKYVVDDEGDLAAPWEQFRTYFMFRGEGDQQLYSVRTFYDRQHTLDQKPELLEAIDDWNRRTLWPKVYTHTHDDGSVRLIGEAQMLIGTGVALEHFVSSTVSWVRASIEFDKWLVETLGLQQELDSDKPDNVEREDGPDDGAGGDGPKES